MEVTDAYSLHCEDRGRKRLCRWRNLVVVGKAPADIRRSEEKSVSIM